MNYLNIAAYKFVDLVVEELSRLRLYFQQQAEQRQLKGTILLSAEGINLFLAGKEDQIRSYQRCLMEQVEFADLSFRESWSEVQPFNRMHVRIKAEIITMGQTEVKPAKKTAAYVQPQMLKQWYEQCKDMIILDTRNDYEYKFGSFENAIHLKIKHFRHFAAAISQLPESAKQKPIVTFCTGGIRCEKASAYMQQQGFTEVYQLYGGILNYFSECGDAHFQGECFVFDHRTAVNSKLEPTQDTQCKSCQAPFIATQQETACQQCAGEP